MLFRGELPERSGNTAYIDPQIVLFAWVKFAGAVSSGDA
jgi:hypothetical protein